MTEEAAADEFANLEIAVEFHPIDAAAAELVRHSFTDEEIFEADAFTGAETITVIVSAARKTIGKVLGFFAQHRQSFKDASLKIGKEEIALTGYTAEEIQGLLDSGAVQKLLRELKK